MDLRHICTSHSTPRHGLSLRSSNLSTPRKSLNKHSVKVRLRRFAEALHASRRSQRFHHVNRFGCSRNSYLSDQKDFNEYESTVKIEDDACSHLESAEDGLVPIIVYKTINGQQEKVRSFLKGPVSEQFFRTQDTLPSLARTYNDTQSDPDPTPCVAYLKDLLDEPIPQTKSYADEAPEDCFPANFFETNINVSPTDMMGITIQPPNYREPPKDTPGTQNNLMSSSAAEANDSNESGENQQQVTTINNSETNVSISNSGGADTLVLDMRPNEDERTKPVYPSSSQLHKFTGVWRASDQNRPKRHANSFIDARAALSPLLDCFSFAEISVIVALIFYDEATFGTNDYFNMLKSYRLNEATCKSSSREGVRQANSFEEAEHRKDGPDIYSENKRYANPKVQKSRVTKDHSSNKFKGSRQSPRPHVSSRAKQLIAEWINYEKQNSSLNLGDLEASLLKRLSKNEYSSSSSSPCVSSFSSSSSSSSSSSPSSSPSPSPSPSTSPSPTSSSFPTHPSLSENRNTTMRTLCWGRASVLLDYALGRRLGVDHTSMFWLKASVDQFISEAKSLIPDDKLLNSYIKLISTDKLTPPGRLIAKGSESVSPPESMYQSPSYEPYASLRAVESGSSLSEIWALKLMQLETWDILGPSDSKPPVPSV